MPRSLPQLLELDDQGTDQEAFAGTALAINLHEDRIGNARRHLITYGRLDIADNVLIHASPWRVRADAGIFIVL